MIWSEMMEEIEPTSGQTLESRSDAFEPRTYGTEITVERSIAKKVRPRSKSRMIEESDFYFEQGREKYLREIQHSSRQSGVYLDQQSAKSFIQGKDDAKFSFFI